MLVNTVTKSIRGPTLGGGMARRMSHPVQFVLYCGEIQGQWTGEYLYETQWFTVVSYFTIRTAFAD